jgi:hypothetical protein
MDLPALLATFDFPNPAASASQRSSTIVPLQALYMMNHAFVEEAAVQVLRRRDVANISPVAERVVLLHWLILGRAPDDEERQAAQEFVGAEPDEQRWTRYVHGLLMTNEFVYVD